MCYIWFLAPVINSFYGTNDKDSICRRIWNALWTQLPLFIFLLICIVPTYFFSNKTELQGSLLTYTDIDANDELDGEPYYIEELKFPEHLYVITVWFGLFFVSVCGGVGVIYMPYNLLNDWIFRPKPINEPNFLKR